MSRCGVRRAGGGRRFAGWRKCARFAPLAARRWGRFRAICLAPYLTIGVVLAALGVAMTIADRGGRLDYATSLAVFLPVAVALDLVLLRPIKGLVLAVMMKVDAPHQVKR